MLNHSKDNGVLDQSEYSRSDEKGLNSVYVLKLTLEGFTNRLDVEHEEKKT